MEIKFYFPRWGSEHIGWEDFAKRIVKDGFSGVEVYPLQTLNEKSDLLKAVSDYGLDLVLLQAEMIEGQNFERYKDAFIRNLDVLASYQTSSVKPRFINSQTGKDYYTMEQMVECFAVCDTFTRDTGIKVIQETHRNKWSFAAHITKNYLIKYPDIRLALDLSHWVCVAESYLQDQDDAVEMAIKHADHLHARVGHIQGPQVTDPRSPENAEALNNHLQWWDKWIALQAANNAEFCSITPEFGPYPYMSYQPGTTKPVANQWEINVYMKDLLKKRYAKYL
ncbi:sugar phosphate isomerase/epimerase [Mucilaginibacter sp. UR6-11]|uniref:sugar phosphate isomerase/epimerase n=1 Tax=Mucilaginibacter sp. UR6-11 TaxID=1435644 RepID=UPI001E3CC083|nr:sugar phosphate isomerase/epimerase [Mucilaginibacter sp. UR6-11]MCC8425827.1 sugar phosphate isomerase/epimerase [Mucilaginibacter sp. UR6-11]